VVDVERRRALGITALALGTTLGIPRVRADDAGLAEHRYLVPRDDPRTGHPITRVTDVPGRPVDGRDALWSAPARHGYSKVAAWDAAGDLLAVRNAGAVKADGSGAPEWLLLDGTDYRVRGAIERPFIEMRWWNTRPGRLLLLAEEGLVDYAPISGSTRMLLASEALLERYADLSLANEGNLSNDDTRLALLGTRRDDGARCAVLLDLDESAVSAKRAFVTELPLDHPRVDFASASASGRFIVVNGELSAGEPDRTDVYDASGKRVGPRWEPYGMPSHYDLALDSRGRDIAIGVAKVDTKAARAGSLVARRLGDGEITVLLEGGYAVHASCRNVTLPGWAFVSYSGGSPDYPGFSDELVAVRTDGSGEHRRLCRFDQVEADYWAEPQACPNAAGTRAVFATNGGRAGGPVQARILLTGLPADSTPDKSAR